MSAQIDWKAQWSASKMHVWSVYEVYSNEHFAKVRIRKADFHITDTWYTTPSTPPLWTNVGFAWEILNSKRGKKK